jgi:hypothetical protein
MMKAKMIAFSDMQKQIITLDAEMKNVPRNTAIENILLKMSDFVCKFDFRLLEGALDLKVDKSDGQQARLEF